MFQLIKFIPFIFYLFIIINYFISLSLLFTNANNNVISIKDRSFTIRSIIVKASINKTETYFSRKTLKESYSYEQKRALIEIKQFEKEKIYSDRNYEYKSSKFYLDGLKSLSIIVKDNYDGNNEIENDYKYVCEKSDRKKFLEYIGLNNMPIEFDGESSESHIIGPAKLLIFLTKQMILNGRLTKSSNRTTAFLRNIKCYIYDYKFNSATGIEYNFNIWYEQNSVLNYYNNDNNNNNNESSEEIPLPIQIRIDYRISDDYNEYFIYKFSHPEYMETILDKQNSIDDSAIIDKFTFKLGSGCSEALIDQDEYLFDNNLMNSELIKFSFKSNIKYSSDQFKPLKLASFVAYDGSLGILRFDKIEEENNKQFFNINSGINLKQFYNFKMNRAYNIFEKKINSFNSNNNNSVHNEILNLSRKDANNNDGKLDNSQCVISKIYDEKSNNNNNYKAPIVGHLLVGSNKFVYMGKAQIRGINALVYESHNGTYPFWLDTPVFHENSYDTSRFERKPENFNVNQMVDIKIITIVYLSEDNSRTLLMIEILKFYKNYSSFRKKITIPIYNFKWDLNFETPNGDKAIDLFSLKDYCSIYNDNNNNYYYYSRFDINLETKKSILGTNIYKKLKFLTTRNLALISAIQEYFKIPATMIYDVESKLIESNSNNNNSDNQTTYLSATMRLAEHSKKLVDLKFIGPGRPIDRKLVKEITCRTFQSCYFLAAHLHYDSYFGYDPWKLICYIDYKRADDYVEKKIGQMGPFKLDYYDQIELYKTKHYQDNNVNNQWHYSIENQNILKNLLGNTIIFKDNDFIESNGISFLVKKIHIDDSNSYLKNNNFNKVTNFQILNGFGFVIDNENKEQNRLISPEMIKTQNQDGEFEMTKDQCEAICLKDFNCQSYSICIKNKFVECILSELEFNKQQVMEQIININNNNSNNINDQSNNSKKRNTKLVNIKFNDNLNVTLLRHKNCNIYNKNFLNLFDNYKKKEIIFNYMDIYQSIERAEGCAEICVQKNLISIVSDVSIESNELFNNKEEDNINIDDETIRKTIRDHREILNKQICDHFHYLDGDDFVNISNKTKSYFNKNILNHNNNNNNNNESTNNLVNGYCLIYTGMKNGDEINSDLIKEKILTTQYYFKFDSFYEEKYGIRLKATELSGELDSALLKIFRRYHSNSDSNNLNRDSYNLIKEARKKGFNHQTRSSGSISNCADQCFRQNVHIWPACKSFDVVIINESNNEYRMPICYFNSITLQEAKDKNLNDLIELNDNNSLTIYHYEPKNGFLLEELNLDANIRIIEENFIISKLKFNNFRFNTFGFIVITLISIICGVFIGVKYGKNFLDQLITSTNNRRGSINNVLVKEDINLKLDVI